MTPRTHRHLHTRPAALGAIVLPILAALLAFAPEAAAQPDRDSPGPRAGRPADEDDRPRVGERFRRMRERWRDRDGGMNRPIPPEVIDDIMKLVQEKFPERFERLSELRSKNPARFEALIKRMAPTAMEYFQLREAAPELAETIIREFKNQERLHELARQYSDADGDAAKQAELEKEITTLVLAQEKFLQERIEYRLKDFEDRLRRQQAWLDLQRTQMEREKARIDERVSDRVARIKLGDVGPPELPIGRFGPGGPGEHRGRDGMRGPRGSGGFGDPGRDDDGPLPAGRPDHPRRRGGPPRDDRPRDRGDREPPPPPNEDEERESARPD